MMQPDCAPFSRIMRVSLRVSISAIATVSPCLREIDKTSFRAPIAGQHCAVPHNQTRGMNLGGLHVIAVRAGVADMGVCQGDDLPAIRWVGQDFLIARHRRIENNFADSLAVSTD